MEQTSLRSLVFVFLILLATSCTRMISPVTGNTSMTDTDITTNVQTRLTGDEGLRWQNINVYTYERVVTLRGTVENVSQATIAVCIAKSVPGVITVISRLKLKCIDCI